MTYIHELIQYMLLLYYVTSMFQSGKYFNWTILITICSILTEFFFSEETNHLSPVVTKFIENQQKRKIRRQTPKLHSSQKTRRIYVGCKHEIQKDIFQLIRPSTGGGLQAIDADKDWTLEELLHAVTNIYFPNGRSVAQNVNLCDLMYHLAGFSGSPLPELEGGFTVKRYFEHVKTCPVRLYLHTFSKITEKRYTYICKCMVLKIISEKFHLKSAGSYIKRE